MGSENESFYHLKVVSLTSREHVVNYVNERITRFEDQLGRKPTGLDALNGPVFQAWRDLSLVWLGRVAECTSLLGSLQLLPVEEATRLKLKALALINRAHEAMVMGNRG